MNSDYRFCPRCAAPLGVAVLADRPRRACADAACGYVHWDNPLPVVAALVERDGMIVLARNHAWPEKKFGLITGFLERDESVIEAVEREVREELALRVTATTLIGVYPFQRKNEVILAYHAVAEGEIVLNEELVEYRLIAPEKLVPWESGTGQAVGDWLRCRA